jgi:sulfur transfer complex TusBCD TusB component (DsrH family)
MASVHTEVTIEGQKFYRLDNEKWVDANRDRLRTGDINTTFEDVSRHHPLYGCAYRLSDEKAIIRAIRKRSDILLFADAVTVAVPDLLYQKQFANIPDMLSNKKKWNSLNLTSIANILYIENRQNVKIMTDEQITAILKHLG